MTTGELEKNKVENKTEDTVRTADVHQRFGKVGFLAAEGGVLKLYGRNGERDHLYPLDTAIRRHAWLLHVSGKMFKNGIAGWDEMTEIAEDIRAKILEAIRQRRSLNLSLTDEMLKFEQRHEHRDRKETRPDGSKPDTFGVTPG